MVLARGCQHPLRILRLLPRYFDAADARVIESNPPASTSPTSNGRGVALARVLTQVKRDLAPSCTISTPHPTSAPANISVLPLALARNGLGSCAPSSNDLVMWWEIMTVAPPRKSGSTWRQNAATSHAKFSLPTNTRTSDSMMMTSGA